jgi:hypothetical protein
MSQLNKLLGVLGLTTLLFSCAHKLTEFERTKLPRKKTPELIHVLDSLSHQKPQFFYTKIATDYSDTNRSISFKTSIRLVKDSAVNALITYAKIPIINSIITTDSVTIVNKREKCYITQSLSYIKENFGIEFNYANLEELILGLPVAYDTNQKYFQIHDPYTYIISSHKKKILKKIDRLDKLEKLADKLSEKDDVLIKYLLSDSLKDIKGIQIESPFDSTRIQVEYLERMEIQGYSIPQKVSIVITSPRNQIRMLLDYDKVEIDEPQPLILIIPEGYEKCD